jgi:hypothetical protein
MRFFYAAENASSGLGRLLNGEKLSKIFGSMMLLVRGAVG